MSTLYDPGSYDPSHAYGPGALVAYGGALYVCTVPVPPVHVYAEDTFMGRTTHNGWGRASDGHSEWTAGPDSNATFLQNFSVKNGRGLLTYDGSGSLVRTGPDGSFWLLFGSVQRAMERDLLLRFRITQAQTGWITEFALQTSADWATSGPDTNIDQNESATYVYFSTSGNNSHSSQAIDPGVDYNVRLRSNPPDYTSRVWIAGQPEPQTWDTTVSGSFTPVPGQVLFDPRWDMGVPNQQFQLKYIAELGINPTPDVDTDHWRLLMAAPS